MSTASVLVSSDPFVQNILQKFTALNHLSADDIANIYKQIQSQAQKANVRQSVREEVRELAEVLVGIENDFSTIRDRLSEIDEKKVVLVDGKLKIYAPHWDALHDEYSQLMHLSQTTANTVKSRIDILLKQIIPILQDPGYSPTKKKDVLGGYIKNFTRFRDFGSQVEDRFQRLSHQVGQFRDNLKKDVANQLNSSETETRIDEINKEIEILHEELESIGGFYGGLCNVVKLAAHVAHGTVSSVASTVSILVAVAGIAAFAPIVAGSLLAAILASALGYTVAVGIKEHNAQKNEKKKAIQEFEDERERLIIRRKNLLSVSRQLNTLNTTFDDIMGRLSSIQYIWHMLLMDAKNLATALEEQAASPGNEAALELKISSVKALYDVLHDALDHYTLQVSNLA